MSVQAPSRNVGSRTPTDIKQHVVCLIDEKIDEWRRLRRSLAAAQAKVRAGEHAQPQSGGWVHCDQADVRLLQYKCDRALDALGAAVAARRALSTAERPHPAMHF